MMLMASPAQAADSDVVVLPVVGIESMDAHEREQLDAGLEQGLSRGELGVVGVAKAREQTGATSCTDAACVTKVVEAVGAELAVRAAVSVDGRDYGVVVEVLSGADGSVLQKREASCEICGLAEVANQLANEAAALEPFIRDFVGGRAILEVRSQPEGADVSVDGDAVGKTPFTGEVSPGERVIEVRKKGFTVRERKVTLLTGSTTLVDVELTPAPVNKRIPPSPAGLVPIGVGVAGVVSGAILIGVEEDPVSKRCKLEKNIDEFGTCRFRYSTLEGGIALVAGGAVAIGAGIAILVIRAKRAKQQSAAEEASRPRRFAIEPSADGIRFRF